MPMLVTLSGMVIDVRPEQPEKAREPMVVTVYVLESYSTVPGMVSELSE